MQVFGRSTLLKKDSNTVVFLWNLQIFKSIFFFRTTPVALFEIFCEDFVDMSHEDTSFHILEDSVWLQLICFNCNCILVCEISLFDRWGHSKVTISECTTQMNHYGKITVLHKSIWLSYNWRIKSNKNLPRNQVIFLKLVWGRDSYDTGGKIKKHNSGVDYFEYECQFHGWDPRSKQTVPQIFLHIFAFLFSLLFCQLAKVKSVKAFFCIWMKQFIIGYYWLLLAIITRKQFIIGCFWKYVKWNTNIRIIINIHFTKMPKRMMIEKAKTKQTS